MPTTIHRNNNPINGAGSETPTDEIATAILSGHFPRCKGGGDAYQHSEDQKYRCGTDSDRQRVGQRCLDRVPDRPVVLERRAEARPAAPVPTDSGGPISRPATSPFMYCKYWTTRGLSRPRATLACAMRSGVQPLPHESAAGSAGPAKNSRKVTMLVAMSSAIRARKRRIRNLSIFARVGWPPPVAGASRLVLLFPRSCRECADY